MKSFGITILAIILSIQVNGQYISSVTLPDTNQSVINDTSDISVKYANMILPQDLEKHLYKLSSDEFEGRETGENGNLLAAQYIASQFVKSNLLVGDSMKGYFQDISFTTSSWEDTDIFVNGLRFRHLWDYLTYPAKNQDIPATIANKVTFLGYGIDDPKYSDYRGKSFKDEVILINNGEPMINDSIYRISNSTAISEWTTDRKLRLAKERGVKMVLIIMEDIKTTLGENRRFLLGPTIEIGDKTLDGVVYPNYCFISPAIAKEIIGKKEKDIIKDRKNIANKGKSKPVKLPTDLMINQKKKQSVIKGRNVVGILPGSDLKDEYIIITAHYDHLGKKGDQIFHGADDDGSGTSTVIELAQSFSQAFDDKNGPRRSIIFMLVTGEEKGLLGSSFYVNNPIVPLEKTIADVNIDMVGRIDEAHKDTPNYVYVIGSDRLSTDLHNINEEMNQKYSQLILDYKYNDEKDPNRYYYRSDHYNFAEKGIPAIFFFNGTHADYHQPTDTPDKIDYNILAARGKMIFHTIWELANRDERIKIDGKKK